MKTQTYTKILEYIDLNGNVSIKNISDKFQISSQMVHRHIKKALDNNDILKKGKPPKVYYSLNKNNSLIDRVDINNEIINKQFCFIDDSGNILTGENGFLKWCGINNFDPIAYTYVFESTYKKYTCLKDPDSGLIELTSILDHKLNKNLSMKHLFTNFVCEFEIFGKTKEYIELLNCIGSQDIKLMQKYFLDTKIKDIIKNLIKNHNINAVAFCPSLEPKKHEITKELKKYLNLSIPIIPINKIQTNIFADKIKFIESDYIVESKKKYRNVLLIDSFLLSGQKINSFSNLLIKSGSDNIIGLVFCGKYI